MRRLLLPLLAALACHAHAAPFTPASDDEVVERLPLLLGSPDARRQQRLARARLQQAPAQLPLALQLARAAIERARQLGDPRELGQAQAVLAPWWLQPDPPPAVRLLRATIRQSQHDFGAALADLDALLQPGSPAPLALQAQAELTRASVLQVTGRWAEAGAGCTRLAGSHYAALGSAVQWPAQACLAELASLQGRADEAERALRQLATQAGTASPWLTLVRAELAERRGDGAAQALYREALQAPQPEVYALAAYADWLLAHARPAEVITLLAGREEADALLLRLAIAYRQHLGPRDPRAAAATARLTERFEAAALRGDSLHAREQARYELDLRGDPAAALRHAQANWAQQKEPADALLLARAAHAAGQPQAAEPVRRLVRDTGWQDVRLQGLT
ncbi:MAG TPA: hypothetical protein VFL64_10250 [Rhizobacter sp.]|nr:hypothetical protein [Rhizobacter sp.]